MDTWTNSVELVEQKSYNYENRKTNAMPTPEPDDSKDGTQQFRVENQKQNLSPNILR